MTWNLGGMKRERERETERERERLSEILDTPGLGLGDVSLVAFQEVNMGPGVHYKKAGKGNDEWIVVAGKQDGEWRGRAIAVKKQLGVIRHRQVGRTPKYTLSETGKQLEDWKTLQERRNTDW